MHFIYLGGFILLLTSIDSILCVKSTKTDESGNNDEDEIDDDDINSLIGSFLKRDKVDDGEEHDFVNGLKAILKPDKFSAHHKRKGHHHNNAKPAATLVPVSAIPTDIVNEPSTRRTGNSDVKNEGDIGSKRKDTEGKEEPVITSRPGDTHIKDDNDSSQEQEKIPHDPEDDSLTPAGRGTKDEEPAKITHSGDIPIKVDSESHQEQEKIPHDPDDDSHNFDVNTVAPTAESFARSHPNSFIKSKSKHVDRSQSPNIETKKGGPFSKLFDDIFRKHDTWRKKLPNNGKGSNFDGGIPMPTQGSKGKNTFYSDVVTLPEHIPTQLVTTYTVMDKDAADVVNTLTKGVTEVPGVRIPKTYGFWMFYRDHAVWAGSLLGVLFTVCLLVVCFGVYKIILKYKRGNGFDLKNLSFSPFKGRKLDESPMYIRLSHINNSKAGNHYVVSVLDDKKDNEENEWSSEEEVFNVSNVKPASPAINSSVPVGTSTPLGTPSKRNNNNNSYNYYYKSYR